MEDPGTSSRLRPLQRPKFRELLTHARPGDTVHISEMFRLVRGNQHILDVLEVLHRDQLALRIHDGAFSAMDLTARHPRTGELLSTVKFTVQTLAAAGELQRDLQRELTYDGLRAAEAKGNKGGRRPAVAAAQTADVRTAYLEGRSIAALARDHGVSRGAIRTAVADLLLDHTDSEEGPPVLELPVTLDMPGKVADYLRTTELEPAERAALDQGVTVRRGQGYTLRVSAVPAVTASFSPAASHSTAARVFPQCQPSSRPAASTRTGSARLPTARGRWRRSPAGRSRVRAGSRGRGPCHAPTHLGCREAPQGPTSVQHRTSRRRRPSCWLLHPPCSAATAHPA
ncbi:recombinase family protein [Streptomyces sp. WMMC1477]|uniref:recombinase family protein n=1 Tax=Streptomyces sp. WMMC1477 TaxID=3015155 RepID=UPI0022B60BA6|nr:recombinase family protein [Streptomyces sp. WMMC1477]MCZ7431687.1 recombinase family protein [Streptomyces sp. WMMC1477]